MEASKTTNQNGLGCVSENLSGVAKQSIYNSNGDNPMLAIGNAVQLTLASLANLSQQLVIFFRREKTYARVCESLYSNPQLIFARHLDHVTATKLLLIFVKKVKNRRSKHTKITAAF